jgi:N6-adenosine-specific RNA methylase IME4
MKALYNAIRQKAWLASPYNFFSLWAYPLKGYTKKVLIVERTAELPKQIRRRSGPCYLSGASAIFERSNFVTIYYSAVPSEASNHFAIQNLKVPAADSSAILFLWATMPKLREALDVMEAWGFEYRTGAAWYKDKIGTGYYFRGQFELLLLGVKGNGIGVPAEADRPSSVIIAPRKEHSQKPDEVYEMIERMYPGRKYIELFQRGKPREGWTTWGLEAQQQ